MFSIFSYESFSWFIRSDIYQIFKGRQETNKNAEPILKPIASDEDNICSRIIWLDGLEEGHNKGGNVDSKSRYIYIHGTHEEGLIGTPASHGCIRMKNKDVIELYEKVSINIGHGNALVQFCGC